MNLLTINTTTEVVMFITINDHRINTNHITQYYADTTINYNLFIELINGSRERIMFHRLSDLDQAIEELDKICTPTII